MDNHEQRFDQSQNHSHSPTDHAVEKAPTYRVFQAIFDSAGAIRANIVNVTLSIVCSYAIAVTCLFGFFVAIFGATAASALGDSLFISSTTTSANSFLFIIFLIVAGSYIIGALASSFVISVTSIAIYDGADKRLQPFNSIIRRSLKSFIRVLLSSMLVGLIIIGPVIVLGIIIIFTAFTNFDNGNASGVTLLVPISLLVATIWMIIAALRYCMAPFVALFEPDLPVAQTLPRSHYLLRGGGQWFIFKAAALSGFILLLVAVVSNSHSIDELNSSDNTAVNVVTALLSIGMNGVLVMLYRNRRTVKG
jgi:hypothetical protein